MKKIFLDSNIFLRFFVPDNEAMHHECVKLFERIDQGAYRLYTSPIVFLECYFMLTRHYAFSVFKVQNALMEIASMRNMTIVSAINTPHALTLWQKTGMKFADCLIATQVRKDMVLCTYDSEFKKISSLDVATPEQVIK